MKLFTKEKPKKLPTIEERAIIAEINKYNEESAAKAEHPIQQSKAWKRFIELDAEIPRKRSQLLQLESQYRTLHTSYYNAEGVNRNTGSIMVSMKAMDAETNIKSELKETADKINSLTPEIEKLTQEKHKCQARVLELFVQQANPIVDKIRQSVELLEKHNDDLNELHNIIYPRVNACMGGVSEGTFNRFYALFARCDRMFNIYLK